MDLKRKTNPEKMFKEVDRANLLKFRKSFANTMKNLEIKYGLKIELGSIGFSSQQFSGRINVTLTNGESNEAVAKKQWDDNCNWFGMKKNDFGKTFQLQGQPYEIIGFNPKARKNCVKIRLVGTNNEYRMDPNAVKHQLSLM
jgi:hypothetical protein